MKIAPRDIDAFIARPGADIAAVLVYGPDEGLVRERIAALGKSVVEDLNDPFNVVELQGDAVASDPARLADEAMAQSLMGGRRLVRLRAAGDKAAKAVETFLKDAQPGGNLVIVEGGDLGPRSSMRKTFEKAKNAAAVPCYADDEKGLSRIIAQELRRHNLGISPDALAFMAANLLGDRAVARNEIEKLLVYMSDAPKGAQVELDDVVACTGNNAALSLEDLARNAATGNAAETDRILNHLLSEGTAPVAILRAAQNYFRRLHLAKCYMDKGESAASAVGKLRPPVFFKLKPALEAQLRAWSLADISTALEKLSEAEADCKKTGAPDEALCGRILFALCQLAKRGRRAA